MVIELLNSRQAANYLGISVRTLEKWRFSKSQDLPYLKLGRTVRYSLSDLEKWALSRRINT